MKYIKLFENFDKQTIESICEEYDITNYTINDDGSIDVDGPVYLSNRQMSKLPLKFRKVTGYFGCSNNLLTDLKGCPVYVGGHFICYGNKLTNMEYCPSYVGGDFQIHENKLTSLEGCPNSINESFYCSDNKLSNLNGVPSYIGGNFNCNRNKLKDLNGSPDHVGGIFTCTENNLTSLNGLVTNIPDTFYIEYKLKMIYDILGGNVEIIPNFYDFHILDNLDGGIQTLNLKRLKKFIDLYDLSELSLYQLTELKNYYNII